MINKFIAIIPARGGSKEIKKKNLKLLGGKPLIYWTIKAAVDSKCFNSIIVSTDDTEIEDYCKKFELIIHKRPKKIAKDTTPMVPVVLDVFENYRDIFDKAEGFCLLQPTSPLRSATHLNEAIHLFNDSNNFVFLYSICFFHKKIKLGCVVSFSDNLLFISLNN